MKHLSFVFLFSTTLLSAQKTVDMEALLHQMTLEKKVGRIFVNPDHRTTIEADAFDVQVGPLKTSFILK